MVSLIQASGMLFLPLGFSTISTVMSHPLGTLKDLKVYFTYLSFKLLDKVNPLTVSEIRPKMTAIFFLSLFIHFYHNFLLKQLTSGSSNPWIMHWLWERSHQLNNVTLNFSALSFHEVWLFFTLHFVFSACFHCTERNFEDNTRHTVASLPAYVPGEEQRGI